MKKISIISPGLLAAVAFAALATSAHSQTTLSYSTGDLVLGFNDPNVAGDDYVVDLGQVSYFLSLDQTPGVTTDITATDPAYGGGSLGNLATDLSTIFGTTWYANNAQGDNVQWGIFGASGKSASVDGVPKDTIFLTQAEAYPGAGSLAPSEASTATQTGWNNDFIGFASRGNGFDAATTSTNSNYAVEEPTSFADAWSNNNLTSGDAFGTNLNIEQSQNAALTDIGPTNSQLDLYELVPTDQGGTGTGIDLGSFTLSNTGQLEFTSVPEPSTYATIGLGALLLVFFRRPGRSVIRLSK